MRALLIANEGDDDPGFVGERFEHHGVSFTRCWRETPDGWPDLEGHDLVLLLGSEWSVYWPHVATNVGAERAVVAAAHARGIPTLGICFGAQVLAYSLGGGVQRAATPEIGWCDIDTDVPDAIAAGPWMQWHFDAVKVPPGAVELARSAVCPQAFRIDRTVAVQFHPEVTSAVVDRWTSGRGAEQLLEHGFDVEEVRARTAAAIAQSGPNARRLVDWFVNLG